MGDISRALGMGSSLTFRGQTYPLAPLESEVMAAFEMWLEKRAWEGYKRALRSLPAEEHSSLRSQTLQDIAAGVFSFGSRSCAEALANPTGQKRMLFLLLLKARQPTGPDVTEALVDEIFQSDLEEAMAQVNLAVTDPNLQAPAVDRGSPSPASAPS